MLDKLTDITKKFSARVYKLYEANQLTDPETNCEIYQTLLPISKGYLTRTIVEEWGDDASSLKNYGAVLARLLNISGMIAMIENIPKIFMANKENDDSPKAHVFIFIGKSNIHTLLSETLDLIYQTQLVLKSIPDEHKEHVNPILSEFMKTQLYTDKEIRDYLDFKDQPHEQIFLLYRKKQQLVYYKSCLETMRELYPIRVDR